MYFQRMWICSSHKACGRNRIERLVFLGRRKIDSGLDAQIKYFIPRLVRVWLVRCVQHCKGVVTSLAARSRD